MAFHGEEISMTVRGFTYGYDFYAPLRNVAFHIYAIRQNRESRENVSKFTENEVMFPEAKTKAYNRLNGIIGTGKPSVDFTHFEEEKYGLGQVRSREQFFRTFGIQTDTREIEDGLCNLVQGTAGKASMHASFTPSLRYDSMGIDYSRIRYEHKTPSWTEAPIDPEELKILREKLRKRHSK
jgi:hypothetical protein